jgi:hypothetical protein
MDDIPNSVDRLVGRSSYGLLHWTLHHAEDRSLPQGPQGLLQPSINLRSVQGLGKRELGLRGAKSWKFPAIYRTRTIFFGFQLGMSPQCLHVWYIIHDQERQFLGALTFYFAEWLGRSWNAEPWIFTTSQGWHLDIIQSWIHYLEMDS